MAKNSNFRRSTGAEIEWPMERPLKVLDSKISTSSIYDIALAAKTNYMERFSKANTASLSSEVNFIYFDWMIPPAKYLVWLLRLASSAANEFNKFSICYTTNIIDKYQLCSCYTFATKVSHEALFNLNFQFYPYSIYSWAAANIWLKISNSKYIFSCWLKI